MGLIAAIPWFITKRCGPATDGSTLVGLDTHLSTHCGFCSASHGLGTHVLMGLDTHSCETMVVLCKFFLEALHTWTYTTNWQCYPPMGPRLYTPLSFSPNSGDLSPATLFGLTAGPHQNPDNRLPPFACPPGQTTWVNLHQLPLWFATIRCTPLNCINNVILSLLAGGTLCVE